MQNLGLPGMPAEAVGESSDDDGVRVLDARTLLSHYAHSKVQRGQKKRGCRFCSEGVGSVVKIIKEEEPEPVVDSGDRSDEEGDSTPASDSWWIGGPEGQPARKVPSV